MCEYCECQSIEAIAVLTREHDEIRAVAHDVAAAARAGDRAAAGPVATRLLDLLRPHVAIEERGLFPAMAGEFAAHVAALEDDHRELEAVLARAIDPGVEDPGWAAGLVQAVSDLVEHILREQDGLFPASLSVLAPSDWDRLDRVRADVVAEEAALPASLS